MNSYEEKQETKRQRYLDRASSARQQASSTYDTAKKMADVIPMGQPILVGHHSERGDRNYRKRMNRTFERAFEAEKKAEHYEEKAASVGKGGISSDDPDAVSKLKKKLETMESAREHMKAANKAYKKAGIDALEECDKIRIQKLAHYHEDRPYQPWEITNLGANIRRVKQRINELDAAANTEAPEDIEGEGFCISWDKEENRVLVTFDEKPSAEIRGKLKSNGFRWSPQRVAWVRKANNSAWYWAQSALGIAA